MIAAAVSRAGALFNSPLLLVLVLTAANGITRAAADNMPLSAGEWLIIILSIDEAVVVVVVL